MQLNQEELSKSWLYKSTGNVRSSQIFYNIADESMSQFFINQIEQEDQSESQDKPQQNKSPSEQTREGKETTPEQQFVRESVEKQQIKVEQSEMKEQELASRLEIQIKKHGLCFESVYGEIFIMIVQAQMISEQRNQKGKLFVTNYRFAFFKGRNKKLDLPYGFIDEFVANDKNNQISCRMKYGHSWKIRISQTKKYKDFLIFLQIYLKIDSVRSSFAYSYAHKYPDASKIKHHQIINQFVRLHFPQNKQFHIIDNTSFGLCRTYPELLYVPIRISENSVQRVRKFWNENRFPVIVYAHLPFAGLANYGTIWRSSNLICQRTDQLKDIGKFLDCIKRDKQKLVVFQAGSKAQRKGLEQFQVNSQCEMKYLQIQSHQAIKASYIQMIQCFLTSKKSFIKDVLATKWYNYVIAYLKGAEQIANKVLNNENVLIKCFDGKQKSAILSALAQIIINPFYRTFQGFSVLVQKQFLFFGYPFLDRLGLNHKKNQQSPTFIVFLDCVSKLIYVNQMCFEFNYKYLSKLSNLMYTTLFGTFVTNNRQQWLQNCIATETVPIWNELQSELTQNAYYYQKSGILEVPHCFDEIRIWKEHFWYLTTPPKQTYKIHPLAQDNQDYINLHCHKIMDENKHMQSEISHQKKLIQNLKAEIQQKMKLQKN